MRWLSAPLRWYGSVYIRQPWLFIFLTLVLCELLAAVYLLSAPKQYTATAIIMPIIADKPDQRLLGGDSEQGMASLLFGGQKVPPEFDRFMQTLVSRSLAEHLLAKPEFVRALFSDEWNPGTRTWGQPRGLMASVRAAVTRAFGLPGYTPPNIERIQQVIDDEIKLRSGVAANAQVVTYSHEDPQAALYVLRTVISENDAINREQIAQRIASLVARINELLSSTTDLTMRDTLIPLLVEQRRRQLAVQSDAPFAVDVIDPPTVSAEPTSPKPWLILIAVGAFAVFAAGSAVIFRITLRGLGTLATPSQ